MKKITNVLLCALRGRKSLNEFHGTSGKWSRGLSACGRVRGVWKGILRFSAGSISMLKEIAEMLGVVDCCCKSERMCLRSVA